MTDPKPETATEAKTTEYVEFVGWAPHGTEFYGATGAHTIDRKHMKDVHDIDLGTKEVSWTRGANGRFLVKSADLNAETLGYLKTDPAFKVVNI